MIAAVIDSVWWTLAVLFLIFVVASFVRGFVEGLREYHDERLDRMSEQWRERWHREHGGRS